MVKPVELPRAESPEIAFVGRRKELEALVGALRRRQSLLILGPPGIGKTRLLKEALPLAGQPALWIERPRVLHDLLADSASRLGCRPARFPDPRRASSRSLEPLVAGALRCAPRCVVLEDVPRADPRMYRFLQELYYLPGNCLVVTAHSRDSLGHLRKLLWDPRQQMPLHPLSHGEGRILFEEAARAFRLEELELEEFRGKVLSSARGNPGQIVGMCRLAARAEYRYGKRIKFLPLRIDFLSSCAV